MAHFTVLLLVNGARTFILTFYPAGEPTWSGIPRCSRDLPTRVAQLPERLDEQTISNREISVLRCLTAEPLSFLVRTYYIQEKE